MLFKEPAHLRKHNTEESQYGGAAQKQRWCEAAHADQLEPQQLLAWELEQEKWTEKSDAAILEDPQWQRVGIKRGQSASSSSDDERQSEISQREYSMTRNQERENIGEPTSMSPGSVRHVTSLPESFEDQRLGPRPLSPSMSVKSFQRSEGLKYSSTANYPNAMRALSPPRRLTPDLTYVHDLTSMKQVSEVVVGPTNVSSHYTEYTEVPLGMDSEQKQRINSFSPPNTIPAKTSMTYGYQYAQVNNGELHQSQINRTERILRSSSWNSYGAVSRDVEADELEAEFERLEKSRSRSSGAMLAEERDETEGVRTIAIRQMKGYGLEELEREFERLESRNKETLNGEDMSKKEIIHLEDQGSLEEEMPQQLHAYGLKQVEDEVEHADQCNETLMRNGSMESHEEDEHGDRIGEREKEEILQTRHLTRKTRLQEKLERFERMGGDERFGPDVSRYPRLQQIRKRRRERLKALMTIRQERAEIWNTLEANWEQMENSMASRLAPESSSKVKTPEATESSPLIKPDPTNGSIKEDDDSLKLSASDSLKLSASEASIKEEERGKEEGGEQRNERATVADFEVHETILKVDPLGDASTLSTSLQTSELQAEKHYKSDAARSDSPEELNKQGKSTNDAIPATTLLERITGTNAEKDQAQAEIGQEKERCTPKEDPPSSFGAFLTQSMSDVGTKVVQILKAVKSSDEQHQVVTINQTETLEEEVTALATQTEEGQEDDESSTVPYFGGFEEEDPESEQPGCVNPLQSFVGKQRRIVVDESQGCINPMAHFGFGKAAKMMCNPVMPLSKHPSEPHQSAGYINPLPSNYSDINEYGHHGDVFPNQSEDENKFIGPSLDYSHSNFDERDESRCADPLASLHLPKSKQPKRSKSKKTGKAPVDKFFTMVDDLLVNNILNIVDEKVVDNMAHTFGFD